MNIEDFRTYCLSFKGAAEEMPFAKAPTEYDKNLLLFSVLGKWFCFVNIEIFDFCTLKCTPELSKELQEKYEGVKPGYHMNKKHWISVRFNEDVPEAVIKELVRQSYELVVNSFTKKQKATLDQL